MSMDTDRIRMLNDELRQHLLGGGAVITPGIAALGPEAVERLVKTIAVFDDFCSANDPHGKSTISAASSLMAPKSCSRLIITIRT